MDEKRISVVVLRDMSKAFDSIQTLQLIIKAALTGCVGLRSGLV